MHQIRNLSHRSFTCLVNEYHLGDCRPDRHTRYKVCIPLTTSMKARQSCASRYVLRQTFRVLVGFLQEASMFVRPCTTSLRCEWSLYPGHVLWHEAWDWIACECIWSSMHAVRYHNCFTLYCCCSVCNRASHFAASISLLTLYVQPLDFHNDMRTTHAVARVPKDAVRSLVPR